ncbi:MAG: hypothetical protein IT292_11330 [Deltaproteobacteria bacterium]|nr:hypothetical protein [Deltaproteobacteria bacterium]
MDLSTIETIATYILYGCAIGVVICWHIFLPLAALGVRWTWALFVLCVPLAGVIFALIHWSAAKGPFLWGIRFIIACGITYFLKYYARVFFADMPDDDSFLESYRLLRSFC